MMLSLRIVVFAVSMAIGGHLAHASETIVGKPAVIDGDTIQIGDRQVRLLGIDAPEAAQELSLSTGGTDFLGRGAAMMLRSLITENVVRCELSLQSDARGLPLATCYSGDADLAAEMVSGGMAWATQAYQSPYSDIEMRARSRKVGFWRDESEAPWQFRKRTVKASRSAAPRGCVFKAVSTSGRKTLVTPWSPWYKDMQIDPSRGDRWLCSEAEAVAQGWLEPPWLIESVVSGVYNPSN